MAFDKHTAREYLRKGNFFTMPCLLLEEGTLDGLNALRDFIAHNRLSRVVVKPACGGSSIGVSHAKTVDEAWQRAERIRSDGIDTRVIVEPFCEGVEFTVLVLQNRNGRPVALMPTEVECEFFDYRRKYLPSDEVTYHCPARFSGSCYRESEGKRNAYSICST